MTNKDAEVEIRQLATNLSIIPTSKTGEAITLALKALEQEPNEDAISREETLRTMCANCDDWQTCKMDCQRRKSIEALPPVNLAKKEDAISREEVQDLISTRLSDYLTDETREELETINGKIGDMNSVNPVKTGHWIFVDKAKEHGHCSECDYGDIDLLDGKPHNFCANCGAKMTEDNNADTN